MSAVIRRRRHCQVGAQVLARHRGPTSPGLVPAIHRRVNNTEYLVHTSGCAEGHDMTDAAARSPKPTRDGRTAVRSAAEPTRGSAQR